MGVATGMDALAGIFGTLIGGWCVDRVRARVEITTLNPRNLCKCDCLQPWLETAAKQVSRAALGCGRKEKCSQGRDVIKKVEMASKLNATQENRYAMEAEGVWLSEKRDDLATHTNPMHAK